MRKSLRRGGALVISLSILLMTTAWGISLISLQFYSLRRGERDHLRVRALALADAGAERAIHFLRTTAPDGTRDGSWRTTTPLVETIAGLGSYTVEVADGTGANTGRIVITSTGTAAAAERVVRRTVRMVLSLRYENVCVWNNAIFGGVGQSGKSINGNVAIRGSVHLLGDGEEFTDLDGDGRWDSGEAFSDINKNGVWDAGEPYTDADGDGHYDSREPFVDVNGNGTRDPALTVTDLASEIAGDASMGNNYAGMSSTLRALLPEPPTAYFNGETVQSLSAVLRVKHGRVNVSGSACVGYPDRPGGSPPLKETMDSTYVSDGWGGNKGAASVYSDNGARRKYDLQDVVEFPVVSEPVTVNGVNYPSYMEYLRTVGMEIDGSLALIAGSTYGPISDGKGNYLRVDADGTITIQGIIYIKGDLHLNRSTGNQTFRYTGSGTFVATNSVFQHANLLPVGTFPTVDRLGIIARRRIELATGSGDSQLMAVGAFYAQERILNYKQNEIAGTFVSSYYEMKNVPRIFQVPDLVRHMPPGMPGDQEIWVKTLEIYSRREI